MDRYNYNKGTALFITGVIISIALAVGIGVSTISFRELRITRTILPSFQAFYAADAGVECAFYWANPLRFKYGETSSFTVVCLGSSVNVAYDTYTCLNCASTVARLYTFDPMNLVDNDTCVDLTVRMAENVTDPASGAFFSQCMRIDSFGKNDCLGGGGVKVERGLLWKDPVECPNEF